MPTESVDLTARLSQLVNGVIAVVHEADLAAVDLIGDLAELRADAEWLAGVTRTAVARLDGSRDDVAPSAGAHEPAVPNPAGPLGAWTTAQRHLHSATADAVAAGNALVADQTACAAVCAEAIPRLVELRGWFVDVNRRGADVRSLAQAGLRRSAAVEAVQLQVGRVGAWLGTALTETVSRQETFEPAWHEDARTLRGEATGSYAELAKALEALKTGIETAQEACGALATETEGLGRAG